MKIALFARYRPLYLILGVVSLFVCMGSPATRAQQANAVPTLTPSPMVQATNTNIPCSASSIEVKKEFEIFDQVEVQIKNTNYQAPVYLTGFTIQWPYAQNSQRLMSVSLSSGMVWQSSAKSTAPIIGDPSSANWKKTYAIPAGSTKYADFRFISVFNAGPSFGNNFSGTLTFSCDVQGTNSVSVEFGTRPVPSATPSPTPITPTPITPTAIPVITVTPPPITPSLTPITPTDVEGITPTLPPTTPSPTPITPTATQGITTTPGS
jgi:hypothetical protein